MRRACWSGAVLSTVWQNKLNKSCNLQKIAPQYGEDTEVLEENCHHTVV
jgi:hypothetical protein